MPTQIQRRTRLYGYPNPQTGLQQEPLIKVTNPTAQDDAELGTIWVNKLTSVYWVLTTRSSLGGVPNNTWTVSSNGGGGAGNFTSLTVNPGPTSLTGAFTVASGTNPISIGADASAHTITIGNLIGASLTAIQAGTGSLQLNTSTTGAIFIGTVGMTGNIQIGNSTAGQTVFISSAINTAPQIVNIATGAGADSSTVNILSGNATAGTQTVNILTGNRAGTVNIANGGAANTVFIGSTTGAASTSILAGSAGIFLSAPFVLLPGLVHIYTGAGVPAGALAISTGDLYINTTAATATTRLYIATGAGAWTFFTANA